MNFYLIYLIFKKVPTDFFVINSAFKLYCRCISNIPKKSLGLYPKMIVFPNCKINLGLQVLYKRDDGFHELNTVFYPLALNDCLEIIPSQNGKSTFDSSGLLVPASKNGNLCEQAWQLMHEKYQVPPLQIHLHKRIPIGAGLGGGSSDATFTLKAISDLFELNLPDEELLHLSATLGSDCPFFVYNSPCIASGRGEILKPIKISLKGLIMVLVMPPLHISTKEAFASIKPGNPKYQLSEIIKTPIKEWPALLSNDFEPGIFKQYPIIAEIKEKLYDSGAIYASMSGSGSAVFGLFETPSPEELETQFGDCFYWQEELTH